LVGNAEKEKKVTDIFFPYCIYKSKREQICVCGLNTFCPEILIERHIMFFSDDSINI